MRLTSVIVLCFFAVGGSSRNQCSKEKKYEVRKAVEKCFLMKKDVKPFCLRLETIVNQCIQLLNRCYSQQEVVRMKSSVLETYIIAGWPVWMEQKRKLQNDDFSKFSLAFNLTSGTARVATPRGPPPRPYLLRCLHLHMYKLYPPATATKTQVTPCAQLTTQFQHGT